MNRNKTLLAMVVFLLTAGFHDGSITEQIAYFFGTRDAQRPAHGM
jgi:hypothetical protein